MAKRASCAGVRGLVDRLITHLLLVDGVVETGTVVNEGAVGAVGVVGAVVALLVTLFTLLGCAPKDMCPSKVPNPKL